MLGQYVNCYLVFVEEPFIMKTKQNLNISILVSSFCEDVTEIDYRSIHTFLILHDCKLTFFLIKHKIYKSTKSLMVIKIFTYNNLHDSSGRQQILCWPIFRVYVSSWEKQVMCDDYVRILGLTTSTSEGMSLASVLS